MISDTVWNDAFARAKSVCDARRIDLLDPLLQDLSQRRDPYWMIPLGAAASDRMGMGEIRNEESGQIVLVLMIRVGSMGTPDALEHCMAMSAAFRTQGKDPAMPWPSGLLYDGQSFTPPDLDTTGNWYAMTLMVGYRFQNDLIPS